MFGFRSHSVTWKIFCTNEALRSATKKFGEDAALWAVEQGIADREALGVIGASYGGYAATMAALQRPDLFKVAIAEHAMMDVAYQSQFPPDHWGLSIQSWTKYFGDPKDEADLQIMRDYSPITHAANLQVPMLIVAGKRDGVVGRVCVG